MPFAGWPPVVCKFVDLLNIDTVRSGGSQFPASRLVRRVSLRDRAALSNIDKRHAESSRGPSSAAQQSTNYERTNV